MQGADYWHKMIRVALRKESVDRNYRRWCPRHSRYRSLSARRAWIEIAMTGQISVSTVSLSARRAWIEISIDDLEPSSTRSRSPQGERG